MNIANLIVVVLFLAVVTRIVFLCFSHRKRGCSGCVCKMKCGCNCKSNYDKL